MKSIFFYDANIFSKIDNNELKFVIENSFNYITDDVVKELVKARNRYTENTKFNANMDLVFNENGGINNNISLLISHCPFGLGDVVEHTENVLDLKQDPKICSFHHLWLPFAINPSILTKPNRHYNSELTWRLSNGDVDFSMPLFQNTKNKIRLTEMNFQKKFFDQSDIDVSKIIRTWSKRDKDIRDNNFKITDSRLLVHALDSILAFKRSVNILTADYDLIDLQNSLIDCLYDQYIINRVINKKCKTFCLKYGSSKEFIIKPEVFEEEAKKVVAKTQDSKCYFNFIVWFYKMETEKVYPFCRIIPDWLYEFLKDFRGNVDCLALRSHSKSKNKLKYLWHSNPYEDSIKFEVWREEKFTQSDVVKPILCKMCCQYENKEINNPIGLTSFGNPEEI